MTINEKFLAKLDKDTRKKFLDAHELEVKKIETPSLGLTQALGGGFGFGRQVMLWGSKGAGKSTFCLELVREAQRRGMSCAWFDAEKSYDPAWAARLGVDNDNILVSQKTGVDDVTASGVKLLEAEIDLIVVDSISAILPLAFFDKTGELSAVSDSKQIGAHARDLSVMSNQWNSVNKDTLIVLISQHTIDLSGQYASFKPMGGERVKFNSSQIVRLQGSEAVADQIKAEVQHGDYLYTEAIGRPVTWTVNNNKLGPQKATGEYNFYYQGDKLGVDQVDETVTLAVAAGIIKKSGAWFTVEGQQIQGKAKVVEFCKDNPLYLKELEATLLG